MIDEDDSIKKIVKIDGFPVGWAWVAPPADFDGDPIVIRELLIHESHVNKNSDGNVRVYLGWTEKDLNLQPQPQETGFYRFLRDNKRVFLRDDRGRWIKYLQNGDYRITDWDAIALELGEQTFVKI